MVEIVCNSSLQAIGVVDAWVCPVNTTGFMMTGWGLKICRLVPPFFRERFRQDCNHRLVTIHGQMRFYYIGHQPRFVVVLPVREQIYHQPSLEAVRVGFGKLQEVMTRLDMASVVIPPLGVPDLGDTSVEDLAMDMFGDCKQRVVLMTETAGEDE
jgi:hypothetical protein